MPSCRMFPLIPLPDDRCARISLPLAYVPKSRWRHLASSLLLHTFRSAIRCLHQAGKRERQARQARAEALSRPHLRLSGLPLPPDHVLSASDAPWSRRLSHHSEIRLLALRSPVGLGPTIVPGSIVLRSRV